MALGTATLGAASTVCGALEESSNKVLTHGTAAISGAVGHACGPRAEQTANKIGGTVVSANKAVWNVASLGARSFGRTVVKETAKGVATRTLEAAPGAATITTDASSAPAGAMGAP